jgi:16S rRNA (guanine527-N7)-methyltransferase
VPEPAIASGRTLSAKSEELLAARLDGLGIAATAIQLHELLAYAGLVIAENSRTNLTGAANTLEFIDDHVADSLRVLPSVALNSPIIDVGSGAGLPGIPLAIMLPNKNFVLLEPRSKRARFLESVKQELSLKNVLVVKSKALAPSAHAWLGKARWVLMRAVASPERAFELGSALTKRGGHVLLFPGRARLTAAMQEAAFRAGLGFLKALETPGYRGRGDLWILEKAH